MFQHLYLVKIWSNWGKKLLSFLLLNSFRAGSSRQRPEGCRRTTDAQNAILWSRKRKMRLLAFEWAQNRTVRVNSWEVTELESCNFDCLVLKVYFDSPPGSERVNGQSIKRTTNKWMISFFPTVRSPGQTRTGNILKSGHFEIVDMRMIICSDFIV